MTSENSLTWGSIEPFCPWACGSDIEQMFLDELWKFGLQEHRSALCLIRKKDMILALHVDDFVIFRGETADINTSHDQMKRALNIRDAGKRTEFLWTAWTWMPDKTASYWQWVYISNFLRATRTEDCMQMSSPINRGAENE